MGWNDRLMIGEAYGNIRQWLGALPVETTTMCKCGRIVRLWDMVGASCIHCAEEVRA
jgi:hypothetical protein